MLYNSHQVELSFGISITQSKLMSSENHFVKTDIERYTGKLYGYGATSTDRW